MKKDWKLKSLEDIESITFLRGNGLPKAVLDQEGSFKCVLYGQLYTLYKTPIIKEVISRTNIVGKILSQNGDVLVPGTTTADALGIAIARSLKEEGVAIGGDINIIRTENKEVISDYLSYYLNGPAKLELASYATGTNIMHLSNKKIKNIEIPIPSLEEQKQIVAKLDQCFEAIDKAKANAVKNLDNTKELFQSKLNDIFRQKGKDWAVKEVGDVCNLIGGGTPSKKNNKFYSGDILWATVRDMKSDVITQTEFSITKEAVTKSSTNIIPRGNVIIATRVGLGKVCLINQDTAINQDLRGVIPKEKSDLLVKFLFWWFKSISNLIINEGTGATVQGVKLPFIKSLKIPIPTKATQINIVALIDTLQKQTQSLESKYQQELNSLKELKKSILQKAFEGEL